MSTSVNNSHNKAPPAKYNPYDSSKAILFKLKELLEFLTQEKSIHTLSYFGNRMSNSLRIKNKSFVGPACFRLQTKLTPPQLRMPWNIPTDGSRIDLTFGVGVKFQDVPFIQTLSFEISRRTTENVSGRIAPAEKQKVGYVRLRIWQIRFQYYNDHYFVLFPMGGGTDQGDTAGFNMYWLPKEKFRIFGFTIEELGFGLKLATGIPNQDPSKIKRINGRQIYSDVEFNEIIMGALYASVGFKHESGVNLQIQAGIDSSNIGHYFQNVRVHREQGIPEFEKPDYLRPYLSVGVSIPFNAL